MFSIKIISGIIFILSEGTSITDIITD